MSTIIQQGSFTGSGVAETIKLRSDTDWMEVTNYTQSISTTADTTCRAYWQRGMTAGLGIVEHHAAADDTMGRSEFAAGLGFTLVDSSSTTLGAAVAVTNITAATPPLVLTGTTTGLIANSSIIRLVDISGGQQYGGMDWSIGAVVGSTSAALAHSPQPVAATTGFYRIVAQSTLFYPKHRYITSVTKAASAVITMSVTHDYVVGQLVRFTVPAAWGMTELNGLSGTITAVDKVGTTGHNTITVDIDSTALTTFALPATAAAPFSPAMVTPMGVSATDTYGSLTTDATVNEGYIGMVLGAGALGAAGASGDVCYWRAGKSFNL